MSDLLSSLAAFCQTLRGSGIPVGPSESVDALRALPLLDLGDKQAVYTGLRAALVKRVEHYPVYEAAFRTFFDGSVPAVARRDRGEAGTPGGEGAADSSSRGGYTPTEALLAQDLATLDPGEAEEAQRAAAWVARRLALRLARRRRAAAHGRRISLRATARLALRTGGAVARLIRQRRRRRPAHLALLLDVSGSMALYSRFLLLVVEALARAVARSEAYAFSTRLGRPDQAKRGGGTRIGAALHDFADAASLRPDTAVIILSDGLDTGQPDLVASAMARIRQRSGLIIWLNPLAGDPQFQPLARAMAAALPYIDVLAPGHSLASLLLLERHLTQRRRSRR